MNHCRHNLTLDSADLLADTLINIETDLSEYSFSNLFLFRRTHDYHILEEGGFRFISGMSYDRGRFIMPLQDLKTAGPDYRKVLIDQLNRHDFIYPVPEEWLHLFPEETFQRTFNESDSDYLYTVEKMSTFAGKKWQKKRNLYNQFLKNYTPDAAPLHAEPCGDCIALLDQWQERTSQELDTSDYYQCREALENLKALNLDGWLIKADGKPAAFYIGEQLNNQTWTIHFAKADTDIKGIYQYLFHHAATQCCSDLDWINLEQDLGQPGLRQTKRSYIPEKMGIKYRICLR